MINQFLYIYDATCITYIFRKTEIKKKLYYLPLFDSKFIELLDDLIMIKR